MVANSFFIDENLINKSTNRFNSTLFVKDFVVADLDKCNINILLYNIVPSAYI